MTRVFERKVRYDFGSFGIGKVDYTEPNPCREATGRVCRRRPKAVSRHCRQSYRARPDLPFCAAKIGKSAAVSTISDFFTFFLPLGSVTGGARLIYIMGWSPTRSSDRRMCTEIRVATVNRRYKIQKQAWRFKQSAKPAISANGLNQRSYLTFFMIADIAASSLPHPKTHLLRPAMAEIGREPVAGYVQNRLPRANQKAIPESASPEDIAKYYRYAKAPLWADPALRDNFSDAWRLH